MEPKMENYDSLMNLYAEDAFKFIRSQGKTGAIPYLSYTNGIHFKYFTWDDFVQDCLYDIPCKLALNLILLDPCPSNVQNLYKKMMKYAVEHYLDEVVLYKVGELT